MILFSTKQPTMWLHGAFYTFERLLSSDNQYAPIQVSTTLYTIMKKVDIDISKGKRNWEKKDEITQYRRCTGRERERER